METIITDWLQVEGGTNPKRKRAEQVCSACHAKKIKCDLQKRLAQGEQRCTACDGADRQCDVRHSKRRRKTTTNSTTTNPTTTPAAATSQPARPPEEYRRRSVVSEAHVDLRTPPSSHFSQARHNLPNTCPSYISNHSPESFRTTRTGDTGHELGTGRTASDVDTGFLQVYGPEQDIDVEEQEQEAALGHPHHNTLAFQQRELHEIFAETYSEYCFTWCPVLDPDTLLREVARSPLLANAVALAASHIRPPLLPHDGPAAYYKAATTMFYNDEEPDPLTTLQAVSLFYWWAKKPPTMIHRHSSWWWQTVIIRQAQQMNIHRETQAPKEPPEDDASPIAHAQALLSVGGHYFPAPASAVPYRPEISIRRRIWWTAFARERLTALCQSKPAVIDPEDCNIQECTLHDFPPDPALQRKGEIFIYWVRLCGIMGRMAKQLTRAAPDEPFPLHLRRELVTWVKSLPPHLVLPIQTGTTSASTFDRDIHLLHLPYFTSIIVLHLRKSARAPVPQALPAAILAASCTARILRDVLARGDSRYLPAITCWYTGSAFIALLQATRIESIAAEATAGLDIITATVDQLQIMWGSAKIIRNGFDRLRAQQHQLHAQSRQPSAVSVPEAIVPEAEHRITPVASDELPELDKWESLFPFVTRDTSGIAATLLPIRREPRDATRMPTPDNMLFQDRDSYMAGLLDPFGYGSLEFADLGMPEFGV
ncbi:uncharacterized protein PgNI_11535 [Pyricularia grisea]|uniref:Zn(2)-C6 fungal-type domain-containing protein n=1 Tax=Pyricularia grisea TaxID=148305 RepID=A0A6P8ANE3_PYRGI|nr:uncharacterized protein PgNI_11535 [Pyricularia grisea]TLD03562.1 hypothetical protein PgNI_11535 [Pyricularia grisea]